MDKQVEQTQLRILLLEDVPTDAELVEMALRQAGLSFTTQRVDTRETFILALEEFKPDIVLVDYNLPTFDGGSAVQIVRQQYPTIPVMVVTGALGEEKAVELLRLGAKDYILKDRLARLGAAVQRVLAGEGVIRAREAAEEALRESEERYRSLFDQAADPIWLVDAGSGVWVNFNTAAHQSLGYTREEFLQLTVADIEAIETAEDVALHIRKVIDEGRDTFETVHLTKQGERRNIMVSAVALSIGEEKFTQCILRDITERKQIEKALTESERQLRLLLDSAAEAIYGIDLQGSCTFCNPSGLHMLGYRHADEMIGKNMHELIHNRHEDGTPFPVNDCRIYRAFLTGENTHADDEVLWRADGTCFPAEYWSHPQIRDGAVVGAVVTFMDITARKKSEETIWKQANFDALTGLPNRNMFRDRLEQEVKKVQRSELSLALMLIDLDRFKEINDTLGHDMGDILLLETARRINDCVRVTDTVACLGGDEFIVLMSWQGDISNVELVAGHILQKLAEPFLLGREVVHVSASIGITLYPEDATETETLLKNADQAMNTAKHEGRNRFSYFTQTMQDAAQSRLRLTNDLRGALDAKQLMVYFQPIVELATGNIHKAEALIRWQHPERGFVSPAEFIPLAEDTGLIYEIGDWVFHESMRWAKRWRSMHNSLLQISVNKSPLQFYKDGANHSAWLSHLHGLDLPGQCLAIEITEGLLMASNILITDELLALRDAGIQVSLDDFGTGYSSLSYLKKFHIDYLKIDQSFVRDLASDPNDLALAEAIIVMGHKLGMKIIAEGVETREQLNLLVAAGCDYAQGYLFSKPVPPEEFEKLLGDLVA